MGNTGQADKPSTIREKVPENWGAVGTFAYQTGMSMADFLTNTAITGGNQAATLAIMGSGAAADTTIAAKERGLEDWKAFTLGTIAGLAEVVTEKVSLDKLFDADLLKDGALKYVLTNAFTEGSEEVASSTVNMLADLIVSRDQDEWLQSIDAYMDEGLTEDQAFARAMADQALSLGVDFLGGFISGGVMGGGGSVIGSVNTHKIGNELGSLQMSDKNVRALIETGLKRGRETASYKLAVEMQAKIKAGEALSHYDVDRLYQANAQAIQAEKETGKNQQDDTIAGDDQTEAAADDVTDTGGVLRPTLENEAEAQANDPGNISLKTLDDETGGEVSAEAMRRQAHSDFQSGKITEAEFDSIMDEVMHLEELENGTSVKTLVDPGEINTNVNGGNINGNIQNQPGGAAVTQAGAGRTSQYGANLSDGVQLRDAGQGARVQNGQVAGGPRRQGAQANNRAKAVIERQNTARDLRQHGLISNISSWGLGIESGTDTENLLVMPQEYYDEELQQAAQLAKAETGLNVAFTVGDIEINERGQTEKVRGAHTGQQIIAQCDNTKATAMQIVKHEIFHDKAMKDPYLIHRLKEEVLERFTPQEFDAVMDRYIDELWPMYGSADEMSGDEYESVQNIILEEMLADAYAGINAFGAHAERFAETANELTPSNTVDKQQKQDNGTAEPTGPPSDRYSYAGENAAETDQEEELKGLSLPTLEPEEGIGGYDGKVLAGDGSIYSYDFLTGQPDMNIIQMPDVSDVRGADGRIEPSAVVTAGMKNARTVGTVRDGNVYVTNRYTGRELRIDVSSIRHGLNGRMNRLLTNARLGSVIGDVVHNAIPINALHNEAQVISNSGGPAWTSLTM